VATKTGPSFFEPAKRKNGCIQYDRPREHTVFIVRFSTLLPVAATAPVQSNNHHNSSAANTKQSRKLLLKNSNSLTHRPPQARNAKRSAKRSLVTFFGFGKKVTRLSAGTDGLDLKISDQQSETWNVEREESKSKPTVHVPNQHSPIRG
jgi:hypothetical protein